MRIVTMTYDIIPSPADLDAAKEQLITLATNAVSSPNSRRSYRTALADFLTWATETDPDGTPHLRPLNKALVQEYKTHLQEERTLSPSSINVRLSAIRRLVKEAADNGLVDQVHANGIANVEGVTAGGVRAGNWLTKDQAQALINQPDGSTKKGLRDRAILTVLLLAGLRREEAATLTVEHLQQRDGRWAIVDIVGKRSKVRTVPIKPIVKVVIDDWLQAAGITEGYVFRSFRKGDHIDWTIPQINAQAIWRAVTEYAEALGLKVAPHDLRRTYAKLAHKGGAPIEQISINLGHGSITTTERYLGVDLDYGKAPSDFIDLTVDRQQRLEE